MDFISKCDQICRKLQIRSHLLKKSFMENFIFEQFLFSFPITNSLYAALKKSMILRDLL